MQSNGNDYNFPDRKKKLERARNEVGRVDEKICPFMSNADKQVECTPQCKLYRPGKRGYECYFMELQAISWWLNPRRGN